MIHNYKTLVVWQKSIELVVAVYKLTEKYPKEELYGLTSQTRRAASSIPANIAEGKMRGYETEFERFLMIAFGSGGELETHLEIAKRLPATKDLDYTLVEGLLDEVMKMLNVFITKLESTSR